MAVIVEIILAVFLGMIIGGLWICKLASERIIEARELIDKLNRLYFLLNEWLKNKQQGIDIADYFLEHNYSKVGIYGMNHVGQRLLGELRNSKITVCYGIDKNADMFRSDIKLIKLDELKQMETVDVIIVTPIVYFDDIALTLKGKVECPIISLEDIVYR